MKNLIATAAGRQTADLVLKNTTYLNVFTTELCHGDIAIVGGRIAGIGHYSAPVEVDLTGKLLCPGFVDAHIHLESSLVTPGEFARAVLPHGTCAVVTDPHEIANVMGTAGIDYMLQATEGLPLQVFFQLPSCVPATPFDESGAALEAPDLAPYYHHPRVLGLAELMNFVGTVQADTAILQKLDAAAAAQKRIDGHAPGLTGRALSAYVAAGVSSDHECSTAEEAMEKLRLGQYIMIREGTAARNLAALLPLLRPGTADRCMFCTDDKHPGDLMRVGHMDAIVRKAVALGADPLIALKCASFTACQYFGLRDRGAIAPGCRADLVVLDSLESLRVEQVYVNGHPACKFALPAVDPALTRRAKDSFRCAPLAADRFALKEAPVIGLVPGEILTTDLGRAAEGVKAAVMERHHDTGHMGLCYLEGYGLTAGAVATSIAHDSHNLIVVGTDDADMALAANRILSTHGGIVVVQDGRVLAEVVLEIGGLMTERSVAEVDEALEQAKAAAHRLGVCEGIDPFMTLSFLSLPVIPTLRLTTKGVFDAATQQYR